MECIFIFDAANRDMQRFVSYADQNGIFENFIKFFLQSSIPKKKYTRDQGLSLNQNFIKKNPRLELQKNEPSKLELHKLEPIQKRTLLQI